MEYVCFLIKLTVSTPLGRQNMIKDDPKWFIPQLLSCCEFTTFFFFLMFWSCQMIYLWTWATNYSPLPENKYIVSTFWRYGCLIWILECQSSKKWWIQLTRIDFIAVEAHIVMNHTWVHWLCIMITLVQ